MAGGGGPVSAIVGGWLSDARRCPSPNQDERPIGAPIDLLVIHSISLPPGRYGGSWIEDLFHNRLDPAAHPYFAPIATLRVSAHLLIRRDGMPLQFVPFDRRAWHAGVSCYQGRAACNDFSVGIELEGCDEDPFTEPQYQRLAAVTRILVAAYPRITPARIVGHSDIAPGRKTDPGPCFDWPRYSALLSETVLT